VNAGSDVRGGLGLRSVVRRHPGLLSRSTADGYLLHTGSEVVAVTGVGAELLAQIADATPVDVLVDRLAAAWGRDRSDAGTTVLEILADLETRRALEVLP
jgi:hypothetical protein